MTEEQRLKRNAYMREWLKRHPYPKEKYNAMQRARRAAHPVDPNSWHLDHKIPISIGGTHCYDNVAVAHPSCNFRKGFRQFEVT